MKINTMSSAPPLWGVIAAFAAIYLIWGSTYLAIRYAVESIPPFLMAGTRNLAAGLLLYAFAHVRGSSAPTRIEWRDAVIIGGLMLLIGNGCVTWAEQVIPSGVAALLVALTPLWMVLLDWLRPNGIRPGPYVIIGLVLGFGGVALLARGHQNGSGSTYGWGVVALVASSVGWSLGSIFNRGAHKPGSPLLAVAMQLIAGGSLLLGAAVVFGEAEQFSFARITPLSMGAWLYLTVAGSLVAYTAYVWLLQVTTPAHVSTSAYVNPLIAVLLGCTIGQEAFSRDMFAAGVLIILAVVMIVRSVTRKTPAAGNLPTGKESSKIELTAK
jgi:drug/metabolite transporter (DMT)-like permease